MRRHRVLYVGLALCISVILRLLYRPPVTDTPYIPSGVTMEDNEIQSAALGSNVTYRVIRPTMMLADKKLSVVLLLHGAGEDYRSWSNHSTIADLATHNVLLIMPNGGNSYWINAASGSHLRYEDYVADELLPDVRRRYPTASTDPRHTAIIGISRGGYGAFVLGFKHPQTFGYVGGISPAVDLPEREFSWKHFSSSIGIRSTFGPMGSATRRDNDPFLLVSGQRTNFADRFFDVECGDQDVLASVNARFAKELQRSVRPGIVTTGTGRHDWDFWNRMIPDLETHLLQYFDGKDPGAATP